MMLGMDDLPRLTTQTFIGIVVAISGNVLISLALNLQKLAHKRLDKQKYQRTNGHRNIESSSTQERTRPDLNDEDDDSLTMTRQGLTRTQSSPIPETQPLLRSQSPTREYIGTDTIPPTTPGAGREQKLFARILSRKHGRKRDRVALLPVDIMEEEAILHGLESHRRKHTDDEDDQENESAYLRSKSWWLGFLLMNVGELGNFISYAFAPASIVAPLGTFALIANCVFAPMMLGEHFRKRDFFGICIAIVGAVTVVLSSNASNARLDHDQLIQAVKQTPFLVYSCIYIGGAIVLAMLSQSKLGRTYVFIDVGLCALFGGFTVLSTKALSTLITLEWYGIFADWIAYPLFVILLGTGIGQIRYLNRALMRFDSKTVIPIQFVFFTLSAIIGSAIMYGDFKKARFHEIVTFLYGCVATFIGVFILAQGPNTEEVEHAVSTLRDSDTPEDGTRSAPGTVGRRQRATLILSGGMETAEELPTLRSKRSNVGLVGLSPAQHLLLVHTPMHSPARELPVRGLESGHEDGSFTPDGRNKAPSGFKPDDSLRGSPRSRSNTLRASDLPGLLTFPSTRGNSATDSNVNSARSAGQT